MLKKNKPGILFFICCVSYLFCSCPAHRTGTATTALSLPPSPEKFSKAVLYKKWWERFNSPELNRLVEQVLSDNLNLKQAYARLDQAKAYAEQAGASRQPKISMDAGAERRRSNISAPLSSKTIPSYNNQYFSSVGASYEIDLWGRLAALRAAAVSDVRASQSDIESMAMSLAAEVTETWFSIIEQQASLRLLREQLKVSQTYLKLIQLRFGQGLVSALDVFQQRQQVSGTRAQIPLIESQIRVLLHKMAVLMGQPVVNAEWPAVSGQWSVAARQLRQTKAGLPYLPPLPDTGIPSGLLKSRPDVRAARLRIAAADHQVGAAIADRFPSLRLSASTGFRAAEFAQLLENLIWNIAGSLSASLWDGGNKSAEVQKKQAVLKERVAGYVQTALKAFQEAEDAMTREKYQRIYLEKLNIQMTYAKKSLEESRTRYLNGQNDYLRVLTALTSVQTLEQKLISAKKQLLSHRIQLYRSMGGAWSVSGRLSVVGGQLSVVSCQLRPPATDNQPLTTNH